MRRARRKRNGSIGANLAGRIGSRQIGLDVAEQSGRIDAANRLLDRIEDACRTLSISPGLGHARPEFASGNLRSWTVASYVIFYEPLSDGIRVIRVLHGARDHQSLL